MKVFFVGGGTGGPTAPLIAIAEELKKRQPDIWPIFIGVSNGIEKQLLKSDAVFKDTLTIPAGKWRRYFSFLNLIDIFRISAGFFKSLYLIHKEKPAVVFGAGSYAQVPMAWACWVLKTPFIAHQQDLSVLLSTKLVQPVSKLITASFETTIKRLTQCQNSSLGFISAKYCLTGNPVRGFLRSGSAEEAKKIFQLNDKFPTVLIFGGGSGSKKINEITIQALPELVKYVQIIHLTGEKIDDAGFSTAKHYHTYGFLGENMKHAYAIADLVVARGGMSTLTELSFLKKPAVLIPLPASPQEDNAAFAADRGAAVVISEADLTAGLIVDIIRKILWNRDLQDQLKNNISQILPQNADKKIAELLLEIINKNESK